MGDGANPLVLIQALVDWLTSPAVLAVLTSPAVVVSTVAALVCGGGALLIWREVLR